MCCLHGSVAGFACRLKLRAACLPFSLQTPTPWLDHRWASGAGARQTARRPAGPAPVPARSSCWRRRAAARTRRCRSSCRTRPSSGGIRAQVLPAHATPPLSATLIYGGSRHEHDGEQSVKVLSLLPPPGFMLQVRLLVWALRCPPARAAKQPVHRDVQATASPARRRTSGRTAAWGTRTTWCAPRGPATARRSCTRCSAGRSCSSPWTRRMPTRSSWPPCAAALAASLSPASGACCHAARVAHTSLSGGHGIFCCK